MSFGKEMESFINAFNAGMKVNIAREEIMSSRQKRGLIDDPMGPGNFPPGGGTGGGVGETEAPKSGDGGGTSGGKAGPIAWKEASPEQRALLMTISGPESAGDYSVIYGGNQHITDFSKHPGVNVPIKTGPNAGKTSSAAGRYQFLGSTWNNIASAYHLPDFSPENQDKAAWYLATEAYGRATHRDLNADLKSKDPAVIAGIGKALSPIWTSLPGGIEQGTNTDAFVNTYNKFLTSAPGDYAPGAQAQGIPPDGRQVAAGTIDTGETQVAADDQQDIADPAQIDVVPYTPPETDESPPQVEDGFKDMVGYQQGGAIPDDMGGSGDAGFLQFADGGNINPTRDYTQNIAAPTVTMTPRINANVLAPTAAPKATAPVKKAAVVTPAPAPKPVEPKQSGYQLMYNPRYLSNQGQHGNQNNTNPGNMYRRQQQLWAKAQGPGGIEALSPNDRNTLMAWGLLRKTPAAAPVDPNRTVTPVINPYHFAKGGKVANRDQRFQELLKQESRGSGAGGMGGSARDRAARRLSREEGRPSSTAYSPSLAAKMYPPAPRGGGAEAGGKQKPWETREPPDRSLNKPMETREPPDRSGGKPLETREPPDRSAPTYSPPGWKESAQGDAPPGWKESSQGDAPPGWKQPTIDVPPVPPPAQEEDRGFIRNYFGFAKGGAIPDDNSDPLWKKIVRGGKAKPDLTEFKRKAGTLPPETKSAKRKKPKDASKPQKRDQKKTKPRAKLPKEGPIPGQRPERPPLDSREPPDRSMQGKLPTTGPIPTPRPGSAGPFPPRPEGPVGPMPAARPPGPFPPRPEGPAAGMPPAAARPPGPFPPRPEGPAAGMPAAAARPPGPFPPRPQGPPAGMPGAPPPTPRAPGGMMSPIPGVAAPINPGMDAPRGGTWAPPGPGPSTGAGPAPPQNGPPPGHMSGPMPGMTVDKLLESLTPEDMTKSIAEILGVGQGTTQPNPPQLYAKGGAIPDDTPNFPEAEGAGSSASSANEPAAGERGYNESVASGQTANFDEVAQRAAPSVRAGVQGLTRIFGLDTSGQQGGMPTPEGQAQQDDGIRRFASGEGAATDEEVQAIDATHGNDRVQADEGTKNLMRIDQVVNFWLMRGDKEKAEAAAASLLQRGGMEVKRAGAAAAAMFDDYQRTGDPNALRHASQMVEKAYSFIPDGADLKIDIDPKTRQIVATTVDSNGKTQKQVVDPQAIPGLLKQAMDGSAYWASTFQIGQPRLAEQQMQNEGAAGRDATNRAANQEYEQYKFERGEASKLDAERRQDERWVHQQEYQTEHGRSPGERSHQELQRFYESWGEDLNAATTPEEKQGLIEEGLGYRFDNTRDRQDAVAEDSFIFQPESPHYQTFAEEDQASVRDIARVIAQKEPSMDGSTAMEVTSAMITSPEPLDVNPDGTVNVNGNSIVFNPQLLPQLDVLRKKYRQQ